MSSLNALGSGKEGFGTAPVEVTSDGNHSAGHYPNGVDFHITVSAAASQIRTTPNLKDSTITNEVLADIGPS